MNIQFCILNQAFFFVIHNCIYNILFLTLKNICLEISTIMLCASIINSININTTQFFIYNKNVCKCVKSKNRNTIQVLEH